MYIDPFTLFVAGEVLLVYIIISSYLFYKSRLYYTLKEILKEVRRNRMLREMLNAKRLAGDRAINSKLISADLMKAIASGGKNIYTNFIDVKLQDVADEAQSMGIVTLPDIKGDGPAQQKLLALRKLILTLEKELDQNGKMPDEKQSENMLNLFRQKVMGEMHHVEFSQVALDATEDEIRKWRGTIAHLQNRIEFLEKFETQFYDSQQELKEALAELESLKTINLETGETPAVPPVIGEHSDELYRLKCDKFDMQNTINQLQLELEKIDLDNDPEGYVDKINEQINEQAKYMKEADVCISLLEKELETANKALAEAQTTVQKLEKRLARTKGKLAGQLMPGSVKEIDKESLDKLSRLAENQQQTINSLSKELDELQSMGVDTQVIEAHKEQLSQLQQNMQEADTCIQILEQELDNANNATKELTDSLQASLELNENGEQMEEMLRTFIKDSEEMSASLDDLQNQYDELSAAAESDQN